MLSHASCVSRCASSINIYKPPENPAGMTGKSKSELLHSTYESSLFARDLGGNCDWCYIAVTLELIALFFDDYEIIPV